MPNTGGGRFYVGMTGLHPYERYLNHIRGYKASWAPKRMAVTMVIYEGPKKIGIAKDFGKRLSQYRTHNIQNVKALFRKNCPKEKAETIEKKVHMALASKRSHGEWFNVSVKEAISTIKQEMINARQPNLGVNVHDFRRQGAGLSIHLKLFDWPKPSKPMTTGLLIAIIRLHEAGGKLDFSLKHTICDKWKLAPEKYRKNFRDLTESINYAEEKIFYAVEKDSFKETS